MQTPTVAHQMADFVCAPTALTDDWVLHDAKRLLLNQFKAAAEAAQQAEGQRWLARATAAAARHDRGGSARLWWTDASSTPGHAAALHQRLLRMLDFGDSHLPSLGQFTAGIAAPLLAWADVGGQSGCQVLESLAVGIEVAITCAAAGSSDTTATAVGRTAALCRLHDKGLPATTDALHRSLMPLLSSLAHRAEAFEDLGGSWRLRDIALHCRPIPALAQAPVDAMLSLRSAAGKRDPSRMHVTLSPQAWAYAQTAPAGLPRAQDPSLRHCLAAAWLLGQFSIEERHAAQQAHAAVTALGERIEFSVDTAHAGPESCALTTVFHDGTRQHIRIEAFLGARAQPLTDAQLSELFRNAADPLVLPQRSGEILRALWALDHAPDVRQLLSLLRRPTREALNTAQRLQ